MAWRFATLGCIAVVACAALATACQQGSTEPPTSVVPAHGGRMPSEADEPMHFSGWSEPANLGDVVNSAANDQGAVISKDELTLIFASTRPGGFGGNDLWVTRREHDKADWGTPVNLGPVINTAAVESTPALSKDGRLLYFASGRPGGVGGIDIWVSERLDPNDELGWLPPVNLGPAINSAAADLGPTFFQDPETGARLMYFYSTRSGGPGLRDIYQSTADEHGAFAAATLVAELSTPFEDEQPSIRRDGLEIYIVSNRAGSLSAATDLWVSTRASTSEPWSVPTSLGEAINTVGTEGRPSLTFDGRALYFFSDGRGGLGGSDLFMITRRKVGPEEQ